MRRKTVQPAPRLFAPPTTTHAGSCLCLADQGPSSPSGGAVLGDALAADGLSAPSVVRPSAVPGAGRPPSASFHARLTARCSQRSLDKQLRKLQTFLDLRYQKDHGRSPRRASQLQRMRDRNAAPNAVSLFPTASLRFTSLPPPSVPSAPAIYAPLPISHPTPGLVNELAPQAAHQPSASSVSSVSSR